MTAPGLPEDGSFVDGAGPQAGDHTGAFLVLMDQSRGEEGVAALTNAGARPVEPVPADDPAAVTQALDAGAGVLLGEIGVAVVTADPEAHPAMLQAAAAAPYVLAIEPERVVVALAERSPDFWRGYRAGANAVLDELVPGTVADVADVPAAAWEESRYTWGLQAVRAQETCYTGAGVAVAVLDTGLDLAHRDVIGRPVVSASFIAGEAVQDGNGHGTHCIGTACGPKEPSQLPRYGVAPGAAVHVGKVLSDAGRGADGGILAGINWAVAQGCRVVSMSLGAPRQVGDLYSRVFEEVAQRAIARGTVIVAAAGNDSRRPDPPRPVSHPANCPSILAVAALDRDLAVASFSNAGLNPDGGQVDVSGPGVDVLSSWPEPQGYRRVRGTSMATPHVAGILALLAEARPDAGPAQLKNLLLAHAKRLTLPATDIGAGLVQSP